MVTLMYMNRNLIKTQHTVDILNGQVQLQEDIIRLTAAKYHFRHQERLDTQQTLHALEQEILDFTNQLQWIREQWKLEMHEMDSQKLTLNNMLSHTLQAFNVSSDHRISGCNQDCP